MVRLLNEPTAAGVGRIHKHKICPKTYEAKFLLLVNLKCCSCKLWQTPFSHALDTGLHQEFKSGTNFLPKVWATAASLQENRRGCLTDRCCELSGNCSQCVKGNNSLKTTGGNKHRETKSVGRNDAHPALLCFLPPGGNDPCLVRSAARFCGCERSSQMPHSRAVGKLTRLRILLRL